MGLSITSMKVQRTKVAKAADGRIVVKRPSTLKDYKRIYKIKNGVLLKARKLEKLISVAA
jgi:ABC-type multidrug transport system fused ATPase/permease subunit